MAEAGSPPQAAGGGVANVGENTSDVENSSNNGPHRVTSTPDWPNTMDRAEEVVLILRGQQSLFSTVFEQWRKAKVHFDFEINIGDDVIPVHRFVLAACSDYIDKMMRRQKNMSNLLLSPHTIRASTVQLILDLIYTGMTNMLRGDFEEFFRGIRDLSIKNTEHNLYLITMWGEEAQVKNNGSLVPTARSPAEVLNKSADSADTEINFDFDKLLASRNEMAAVRRLFQRRKSEESGKSSNSGRTDPGPNAQPGPSGLQQLAASGDLRQRAGLPPGIQNVKAEAAHAALNLPEVSLQIVPSNPQQCGSSSSGKSSNGRGRKNGNPRRIPQKEEDPSQPWNSEAPGESSQAGRFHPYSRGDGNVSNPARRTHTPVTQERSDARNQSDNRSNHVASRSEDQPAAQGVSRSEPMHGFPLPLTTRPSAATMPVASGINRQAISAFQGSEHPSTVEEAMAQRLQQVHQAIAHRVSEAVQTTMAQNTQASVSQAQASIPQVNPFQAHMQQQLQDLLNQQRNNGGPYNQQQLTAAATMMQLGSTAGNPVPYPLPLPPGFPPLPPMDAAAAAAFHAAVAARGAGSAAAAPSPNGINPLPPTSGDVPNGANPTPPPPSRGRGRGRKANFSTDENGKRFVSCEQCGKILADPSSLYRHKKIHTNEKPHVCRFCGRDFIQRYNMTQHIHTHFKPKGANSIFTNNNFATVMEQGDWNDEERAYLMAVFNGHVEYRHDDVNNPFGKQTENQKLGKPKRPAPLKVQYDPDDVPPEAEIVEDDEGDMAIDENPTDPGEGPSGAGPQQCPEDLAERPPGQYAVPGEIPPGLQQFADPSEGLAGHPQIQPREMPVPTPSGNHEAEEQLPFDHIRTNHLMRLMQQHAQSNAQDLGKLSQEYTAVDESAQSNMNKEM